MAHPSLVGRSRRHLHYHALSGPRRRRGLPSAPRARDDGDAAAGAVWTCGIMPPAIRRGGCAMETATMGRVITEATIENSGDLWAVRNGLKKPEEVRRAEVRDALVDTGAT